MVYPINYRRPAQVAPVSSRDSLSGAEKQKSIDSSIKSGSSGMSHGIPEALSFDRIIAGGTCPPCTTRDFMNYLKYIELAAENLQFYLWFHDYTKRFNELPEVDRSLSPAWVQDSTDGDNQTRQKRLNPETAAIFKGTDFAEGAKIQDAEKSAPSNPFFTPPHTPNDESKREGDSFDSYDASSSTPGRTDHAQRTSGAFQSAGLKWKPLTIQPYREEISRIISIYIADDGTRQLNLSSKERTNLLHALQHTTHPSAFREVMTTVEWSLRCQAHPNFIRWTICNGNRPRVIFARGLGVFCIVAGFVAAILITLSSAGRAWRVLSLLGFFIGISTLIAAWKGMCVVLHGMHHRHLRPWELFTSDDEPEGYGTANSKSVSFDTLGTQDSSNSFEDEPWVPRYEKRNLVRKVFDREVWIQEPALRQIQDTIFLQSLGGAFLISAVVVGVFCAVPRGGFF
ncbi:hypothetical protein B0J11DRAFT_99362 [Dendryphion nanum]|uniref:Regulator of G protein signaling superfamily n=1 Tax=Dendryphion nanum TaxID=256645 RepID=A0A9P9DCN1_9PLEO|nr:hypothetical protein B0J11DRAFT_99362 [Dendryphion nanum]